MITFLATSRLNVVVVFVFCVFSFFSEMAANSVTKEIYMYTLHNVYRDQ